MTRMARAHLPTIQSPVLDRQTQKHGTSRRRSSGTANVRRCWRTDHGIIMPRLSEPTHTHAEHVAIYRYTHLLVAVHAGACSMQHPPQGAPQARAPSPAWPTQHLTNQPCICSTLRRQQRQSPPTPTPHASCLARRRHRFLAGCRQLLLARGRAAQGTSAPRACQNQTPAGTTTTTANNTARHTSAGGTDPTGANARAIR